MNLYEIIIIILCILYVLFYLKKRFQKEGFHANMNNYKDAKTYDQIYDDFYGFLDHERADNIPEIINTRIMRCFFSILFSLRAC